ncbi:phosphatidate cytidylyltransferase [Empedobacter sedimenti]|uniref:phosphatidate cytidylyltransferase n=1 Tax=Empedobacter sedimenti TaxID=3042610 RepID=UPI0024A702B3|nr:phosphatidate cytidylyltransferase [Empedobacter sedimenti]
MKNLVVRASSGLVYAIIIFLGTTIHPKGLIVLMMVFGLFCLYEFLKITNLSKKIYQLGVLLASLLIFGYYSKNFLEAFETSNHYFFYLKSAFFIVPVLFLFSIYTIFKSTNELLNDFGKATLGLTYIIAPFALALTLPSFDYALGEKVMHYEVFFVFLLLWCSDTFAYLTGNLIGKHKFAPKISGAKTWEGFLGGIVFTLLAGFLIQKYYGENLHGNWMIIGLIVAALGPFGDLTESKIKRFFNVKDSSNLIPGHGGFLDRLDSFIFVVPFVYLYYLLVYTL